MSGFYEWRKPDKAPFRFTLVDQPIFALAGLWDTLWAQRGGTAWAYFRWPEGMVLRASAKKLAAGVSILGQADSCPIPPSDGCAWVNHGAELEALPYALR